MKVTKKTYQSPQLKRYIVGCEQLLSNTSTIKGGQTGAEDAEADSKAFWGITILDDAESDEEVVIDEGY